MGATFIINNTVLSQNAAASPRLEQRDLLLYIMAMHQNYFETMGTLSSPSSPSANDYMWICYWVPRYGRGNMRCMNGVYEQYI
jgi:hypothetical protein